LDGAGSGLLTVNVRAWTSHMTYSNQGKGNGRNELALKEEMKALIDRDEECIATMKILGQNMAWVLQKLYG